nr:unnamed protein product [Callosobruchus analis]
MADEEEEGAGEEAPAEGEEEVGEPVEAEEEAVQSEEPPPTAEKGTSEKFSSVPVLPSKPGEYSPIPYTFRVPTLNSPIKIKNLRSKCPPYYLLLDHTIAVLWLLFASKEYNSPLGISQLQWALSFLRTVKTRNGDYPKDIAVAINAVEQILVNNYSDLAAEMTNIKRLDEAIKYSEGAFGSSQMITKELPFSPNYAEMFTKSPAVQAAAVAKSMTSAKNKAINVLKMWKTDQVEKIKDELRRLRTIEDNLRDIDANFEGYIEDDLEALTSGI